MRILITGGLGLVGTQLLSDMRKDKFFDMSTVVVVDNMLYETDFLDHSIVFKRGNVGDRQFMENLFNRYNFDACIHLAGIVGDPACSHCPSEAKQANIDSLEILRDSFKGRLIFPSSCSVYGANEKLVNELRPLNPLSIYAEMKVQGEKILRGRKNTVILRLGTLHGVSGRLRSDLVVHALTIRALTEGRMTVFGGQQYRPLLSVKDLSYAILNKLLCRSHITGIYNLVEDNYTILEIAEQVQNTPGLQLATIEIVDMPFEDRRNYKSSAQNAKKDWGFDPKYPITDTVISILNLYKEGRVKDFANIKYSNISSLKFGSKTWPGPI